VLVVLLVLLVGSTSSADPSRRVVLLTQGAGASAWETELLAATQPQLADLGLGLTLTLRTPHESPAETAALARNLATAPSVLVVVWLDIEGSTLTLSLFDPRTGRVQSRRFTPSRRRAATAEEMAIVVRAAASAALETWETAEERSPAPPAPRPASTAPAVAPPASGAVASEGLRFRAAAAYLGTQYADHTPWQNGAGAWLALRPPRSPWLLGAAYGHFFALPVNRAGVRAEITRNVLELFGGLNLPSARFSWGAEGGLELEHAARRTLRAEAPLSPNPQARRISLAASVRARGSFVIAPPLLLSCALGAEVPLQRFDYVITRDSGERTSLLQPYPVRPRLELGLAVDL